MSGKKTVDDIFREALTRDGFERERYVRERCAGNSKLESRVFQLLRSSQAPDDVLGRRFDTAREVLWRSVLGADEQLGEDLSGQRFDAWQLARQLARGGLATVYLAQRADGTYEQTAAFKVLRRGLDTDDLIGRFRAERQILSTLDHPSIAKILDGGALPDGRPYLVLEFVDGLPINDWCEQNQSSIDLRIRLLMDVLQALHHAHRHLVVHRDIKPSNILVSAEGRVSLLDFGIAKLLNPESMPGTSTLTRTGVAFLTPGYGSPEQHAGQAVTTVSDVYQVGLVMYELLTGKRPFDGAQSPNNAIILQPSGELRGGPWYARVRGDLDAITAKATHADPARRYASAADMHDDLQRFLNHRPIRARPDTLSYRLGKLVHRKPYLVPIAIISFFAIAGYITTLTIHARELEIEQRRASAAQAFLVDLLRSPDPFAPADPDKGQDITVVEALDIGVERLESDTYSDPELRVSLLNTISSVYAGLDRHKSAIQLREESLSMERVLYGNDTSQVIDSLVLLGQQCQVLGDYAAATSYFEEQLEIAQRIYGKDDPRLGAAEAAIAPFYFQQGLGNQKDGIKLLESGIEKMRGDAGHSRDLINALVELATWLKHTDPNAALARLGEALELAHLNYGTESLSAALVHAQIATNWSTQSNYDNAESEFLQALAIYESKVGPDHGAAISTLSNLGTMALRMGKLEEAEKIFGQILKRFQRKYGTDHQEVANSYQNLATALTRQGRYEESVPMHRKAVEIYDNVLLGDHYIASFPRMSLAYAQIQLGDFTDAEASAREAFGVLQQSMPESWMAGVAQCLVGVALEGQGLAKEGSEQIESSHRLLLSGNVGTPYRELCRLPEA